MSVHVPEATAEGRTERNDRVITEWRIMRVAGDSWRLIFLFSLSPFFLTLPDYYGCRVLLSIELGNTHTHTQKRVVERTLAAVPLSLPPCIFSPRTTLLYYFLSTGNQIDFERRQAWVYGRQTFHHNLCGPIFPSLFLFLRVVCCRTWRKWVSGVRRTLFIPRKEMQSMTVSLFLIERQRGRHTSWLVRKEETISYNSSRISYLKRPISLRLPIVIYRRKKKRPNSLSSSSSSFFFSLHCYCAAGRTSRTNLAVYVGAVEAPLYMETMGKTEERRCIICPFDQRPAWNIPLRPTRRDGQDGQTDQLMTHTQQQQQQRQRRAVRRVLAVDGRWCYTASVWWCQGIVACCKEVKKRKRQRGMGNDSESSVTGPLRIPQVGSIPRLPPDGKRLFGSSALAPAYLDGKLFITRVQQRNDNS